MARNLTWLHLSDLHACPRDEWSSDHITRTLVEDLQFMEKTEGLIPDFIFFTGDAAWGNDPTAQASLSDQFDLAHHFFEKVRTAFKKEIPQRRLYIVPGNHDIDYKRIITAVSKYLPSAGLTDLTANFNNTDADLAGYMDRLDAFGKFLGSKGYLHLAEDKSRWIFSDEQVISFDAGNGADSLRVGIAGFNTAWSCGKKDKRGELRFCGQWQYGHLFNQIRDAHLRIALLHHPFNWFSDHDELINKRNMMESFHFILHGHEHEAWIDAQVFPHTPPHPHATVSAACCYDRNGFSNGYNFVSLDLDRGRGKAFLRRLTNNGKSWSKDTDHQSAPDGVWPFACPKIARSAENGIQVKSPRRNKGGYGIRDKTESNQSYERGLRAAIRAKNNYLDLPGITITTEEAKTYDLSVAYVSLSLAKTVKDETMPGGTVENVLDCLPQKAPRLLITGPAGCGKTTLIRWVAVQTTLAENAGWQDWVESPAMPGLSFSKGSDRVRLVAESWKEVDMAVKATRWWEVKVSTAKIKAEVSTLLVESWRLKLPLLIRLRDFPDGSLPALADLPKYLAPHLPDPPGGFFTAFLKGGRALVLLDGVDEVPPDNRARLTREIEIWMREYPECYYIITSRPDAVPEDWLGQSSFERANVLPLSPTDRSKFIDFWHRSVGKRYRDAGKLDVTEAAGSALKVQLNDNPTVARLTTNPLLAAAICALHLDGKAQLPRNEGEVCNKLCELLLDLRDKHQRLIPKDNIYWTGYEKLDYDPHKKAILSDVAGAMVESEKSCLPAKEMDFRIGRILEKYEPLRKLDSGAIRKAFIERSGLLRVGAKEEIEFIHNTFKEFLAAERWVAIGEKEVVSHGHQACEPALQPVLRFAAMRASPASGIADKLVAKILSQCAAIKSRSKNARRRKASAQFLLIQIAAAAALSPELQRKIASIQKKLLPPSTFNDAEAIAGCGEEVLKELHISERYSDQQRAACVRALGKMEVEAAKAVLEEYVNDKSELVLAELARYQNPLAFSFVKDHLLKGEDLPAWCPARYVTELSPLRHLKELERLNLPDVFASDLEALSHLPRLKSIRLPESRPTDVAPLIGLANLRSLTISAARVTQLEVLGRLSKIQSLELLDVQVGELNFVRRMSELKTLGLSGVAIADLNFLVGVESLKEVRLFRTSIYDLTPLAGLRRLEVLEISDCKINTIDSLRHCKKMRTLLISGCPVEDIRPLQEFGRLESLSIWGTNVSNLDPIEGLKNIRWLSVWRNPIAELRPVENFRALTHLDVGRTNVKAIGPLAKLSNLQSLDLSETQVTDLAPVRNLEKLNTLDISGTEITNLEPICELPRLMAVRCPENIRDDLAGEVNAYRLGKGLAEVNFYSD